MHRLIITVDVSEDVDPKLVDPHEVADDILEEFNSLMRRNGGTMRMKRVEAEWVDRTPCNTGIIHGPGHQSFSPCMYTGPHSTHRSSDYQFDWDSDDLKTRVRLYGGKDYLIVSSGAFDQDHRT